MDKESRLSPRWISPSRPSIAILLVSLLLIGCTPLPSPRPTLTPIPPPTLQGTPIATLPPPPTITPSSTRPPDPPLGLATRWRGSAQDSIWSIGTVDVEGDGQWETWAASYDHHFYLFDATGEQRWSYDAGAPIYTAQSALLNRAGQSAFLLGCDDNTVQLLTADGTVRWTYPTTGRVTHLATGDVDGDDRPDVVAASWDGTVHIVDAGGNAITQLAIGETPSALAVADLDGNQVAEILVGSEAGQLLALLSTGQIRWQHGLEGPVRGLLVADLDGDGHQEIVAGSRSGMLALIGTDGAPRWARRIGGTIITSAGLPQANMVLVGRREGIVALDVQGGEALWELDTKGGVWSFAVLGSGPEPVLAAGTDGGEIVLFNRWGQLRGTMPLPSRVHGLVSADLEGDSRPELLARSGDYVYAFNPAADGEAGEPPPYVATMPQWPHPSPLSPLPEGRISLLVVGDLTLGRSIEARMRAYGTPYPFEPLAPLVQQADLAIGNLECVLTEGAEPANIAYFSRAHPDMAAGLAGAGFDLISLANNHALDYGPAGLTETLSTLEAQGIEALGAGPQAAAPIITDVQGIEVAFLARNAVGAPQSGIADVKDEETLRRDVRRAKARADLVVLMLHAGLEYSTDPTDEQRQLARAAVEAGADLVVGYQSHLLQGTEQYQDGFIAYGLGDFVYDIDLMDQARDGALLWATLSRAGLARLDWIPSRIVDDVQPRPVAVPGGRVALQPLLVEVSEPLPPPPTPRASYVLSATVSPGARQIDVDQSVGFANTTGEALDDLVFFVFPNAYTGSFALHDIQVNQKGQILVPSYTLAETTLRLFLREPLPPGEVLTVALSFSITPAPLDPSAWPPEGNLARSADGRTVQLGKWYPQLVPYRKGYGWQTWDFHPVGDPYYADLADYRVTVTAPGSYTVFGGGRGSREEITPEGPIRWHFELAPARDMAIFLGRNYTQVKEQYAGITLTSAFRQEHTAAGQAVLEMMKEGLDLFQRRYGPYPYRTLTVFEGEMNGGMEYSGIVLVGAIFYDLYTGDPQAILPGLTVHELAHQWWYGVVGNDQVHEPWLDEAFARYSEVMYYETYYSDTVGWWWQNRIDRWNPTGPVDATIYDYDDSRTYVHNLYGRAAHFMQDLRQRLGDEAFFSFVQRYYRENAWQRVTRRDFFRVLEEQTGVPVDDLVQAYFRE